MSLSDATPEIILFVVGVLLNLPSEPHIGGLVIGKIQSLSSDPVVISTCETLIGTMSLLGMLLVLISIILIWTKLKR